MEFKPLEIRHREVFLKYTGAYGFNTYEYSFMALYMWRRMFNTEFAVIGDTLVIKKPDKRGASYFMQPIGYKYEDLKKLTCKLNDYKESGRELRNLFGDIEQGFLNGLNECFNGNIIYSEDTDNFDYIYDARQLVLLSGKKYHRKRNRYNQFVNSYKNVTKKELIDEYVRKDCLDFAKAWYHNRGEGSEHLKYELLCIEDVLANLEVLNAKGIAVYIGDVLAGFSIGEKVNNKMAVIHIEKGDIGYSGIYAFLNKTMVETFFSDVRYINRQEDLGVEGLRKAKMAYQPVRLEKKYLVDLP